jgi:hypothetical protein
MVLIRETKYAKEVVLITSTIVSSPWFWVFLLGTLIAVAHRRKKVLDMFKGRIGIQSGELHVERKSQTIHHSQIQNLEPPD